MAKIICKQCGEEFGVPPWRTRKGEVKFCSLGCYNQHRKKKETPRVCEQCGKEFAIALAQVKQGKGKFCSRMCKGQWWSESIRGENSPFWKGGLVVTNCLQCGKEFKTKPSWIAAGKGKFCSRICYGHWQSQNQVGEKAANWRGGAVVICTQCGKKFEVTPVRGKEVKFCYRGCYAQWQSENQRGEENPFWRGGPIKVTCLQCGREFEVKPSRKARGDGKYCSQRCLGIWCSANLSGANSPRWRGGISFEPYTPEFNDKLKEAIRNRDGHACAICKLLEGDMTLHVHHINYCKENSNTGNLISLCNSCHPATNSNREYWQRALSPLPQLREEAPSVLRGVPI